MMTLETLDTIAGNVREAIGETRERLCFADISGERRRELLADLDELRATAERLERWREELVAA